MTFSIAGSSPRPDPRWKRERPDGNPIRHPQCRPHHRRHAVGRGRQALWPCRAAGGHDHRAADRCSRPELRRLGRPRRDPRAYRRGQRLRRQGPVRRQAHRPAAGRCRFRRRAIDHRRQYRSLWRDLGRMLFPRRGGRALCGAQFRRRRRRRGRWRSRLRIHDRRLRAGDRRDRPQLRRRHVRRRGLRARRSRRLRQALQSRDGRSGARFPPRTIPSSACTIMAAISSTTASST